MEKDRMRSGFGRVLVWGIVVAVALVFFVVAIQFLFSAIIPFLVGVIAGILINNVVREMA